MGKAGRSMVLMGKKGGRRGGGMSGGEGSGGVRGEWGEGPVSTEWEKLADRWF